MAGKHASGHSGRHVGICPVTGKRMYATKRDAKLDVKNFNRALQPYRGACCGHFHTGHHWGLSRLRHRIIHGEV